MRGEIAGVGVSLILVGLNHRTAPVELRERLSANESQVPEIVRALRSIDHVTGAAVVSTCNRVEAVVSCGTEEVSSHVVDVFSNRGGIERSVLEHHLYVLRNREVIRHLFRVAAGLDSMIVGEPQIGGQVRAAYQTALELQSMDPSLQRVLEQTLRVAKRVRTDTGIGEHAVSIPFAGVELAKKIFGNLDGLSVLLVGAGEIAELTAQHLSTCQLDRVIVANRSLDKAEQLAARFHGTAVPFESLQDHLRHADIVITSTAAPHHIIRRDHVELALADRKHRSLFLIDLAVPRNIDPEAGKVAGAYLYDVDDLKEVADSNLEARLKKAAQAEKVIENEVDDFMRRLASQEAVPTIVELQSHLEEIRRTELERCLRRLGPISAEQREAIEALTAAIVNKILHYPVIRIKESAATHREAAESMRETIRKLFGLR